ncbi:MAG: hypothetical protein HN478_07830 [Rhodospirillaceae bacterium]|nr:hypothetical protein [Rhodospirillaceae bacterium]MBT4488090.1 hypothetical protein [Rhodospirillaceae bacterium]MBT5895179.1 hypothetical protein [Rhodospirillaceae bacterium]MBT7757813.1 hypothetical protein [Rhodospirillaceae bacterium]
MAETAVFQPGGYRYVRGPFQYSGGVAAEPGFAIERVRFAKPRPIEAGFRDIEAYLEAQGRPFTSFCACELRSPAPFDDAGFIAFNRIYVGTLERWGIFKDDENPVARSNVCPEINPPSEPVFEAFSYTVPETAASGDAKSFVIAGSAEAREASGDYAERIVRLGETTADAMEEKALHVLGTMETRMAALGFGWADAAVSQVYTIYDLHPFFASQIETRGAASAGLTWYYARPPVVGLDYEMDVRCVPMERII